MRCFQFYDCSKETDGIMDLQGTVRYGHPIII